MAGIRIVPKTAKVVIERTELAPTVEFDMTYDITDPIRIACEVAKALGVKIILRHFAHNARDAMHHLWCTVDCLRGISFYHGTGKAKTRVRNIHMLEYTTHQMSGWPLALHLEFDNEPMEDGYDRPFIGTVWKAVLAGKTYGYVTANHTEREGILVHFTSVNESRRFAYFKYVKDGVFELSPAIK